MKTKENNLIHRKCFICQDINNIELVKVPYLFPLYSKDIVYKHNLVKCRKCCNYYINPTLSEDLISKYYETQTSYEINDTKTTILDSYELKSEQQKKFVKSNIDVSHKTILDFGCATAYTLNKFKENTTKLIGFDTSKECSLTAKEKYDIEVFTEYNKIENYRYDLVMLSHVLEHLISPYEVLNGLTELMNKEAYLYIEVPYIESFEELDDEEIFGHISFEHLNYFNKTNLSNLMRKLGFKEIKLDIAKNDNGTMPNYPVILSLWQLTEKKEFRFDNSESVSFENYLKNEDNKLNEFNELIENKVNKKRIIIYGTGTHTYRLLAMCSSLKENIIGFSDGNNKKYSENSFYGLPCKAIEDFDHESYDSILISSKASENEIYDTLKNKTSKEIIKIYG